MFGNVSLPEELANICNGLAINGTVCQGFHYNSNTKLAVFTGQPPNLPLDLKHYAFNFPGSSFWALTAGKILQIVMSVKARACGQCCRLWPDRHELLKTVCRAWHNCEFNKLCYVILYILSVMIVYIQIQYICVCV